MTHAPLLLDVAGMERALTTATRIAVLGIKPESRRTHDAHQIPLYLERVGYALVPVPTRYPEATTILGVPVVRSFADIEGAIDIVSVFARPDDFAPHLADVLGLRPAIVWFQSGLLDPPSAAALLEAGIAVAEDCIGCRRASMPPSWAPLEGQR